MIDNDTILKLMVAPAAEVLYDTRRNFRWVMGIVVCVVIYVILSSIAIHYVENWSFLHASYFTVINMTTVGFGDVVPLTHMGKIIAGLNAFVGVIFFGILVAIIAMAFQPSGFAATLTSKGVLAPREQELKNDSLVKNGTADFLEGLAKIIRATDSQDVEVTHDGRIRIDILRNSENLDRVHISVDIYPR